MLKKSNTNNTLYSNFDTSIQTLKQCVEQNKPNYWGVEALVLTSPPPPPPPDCDWKILIK